MPDLSFQIEGAIVVPFAVAPTLAFKLRIKNAAADETIHTVALRCQIQIEVTRRRYTPGEQEGMRDLFGEPDRWSQTLRSLLWTHANMVVPAFPRQHTRRSPCSLHLRLQRSGHEVL